ncbi:MAG: diphthine--ammonia ligase [Ignavibacteria bacterium]|jgi:uncharacterized protein (TIGR00290 family)
MAAFFVLIRKALSYIYNSKTMDGLWFMAAEKEKVLLSWSGGKDSTLVLNEIKKSDKYEIAALLTTVTEGYDRISMHGVRRDLLHKQAESLGYPLVEVVIPQKCTDEKYGELMKAVLLKHKNLGINKVIFGDLFLEDIREYREKMMSQVEMECVFPLWGRNTTELAKEFIEQGFKCVVVCVDTEQLNGSFSGRDYDLQFLADLPKVIDPCGENGEFHTFVYDGQIFSEPIKIKKGDMSLREERFSYCDLV